jgi:hypothetical protein
LVIRHKLDVRQGSGIHSSVGFFRQPETSGSSQITLLSANLVNSNNGPIVAIGEVEQAASLFALLISRRENENSIVVNGWPAFAGARPANSKCPHPESNIEH